MVSTRKFYSLIRVYPESYPTGNIELYRRAYLSVSKDAKGRIPSVTRECNTALIQYDDKAARNIYQNGSGLAIPVWKISSITYSDPSAGQTHSVKNTGWIFRGEEEQAEKTMQELENDHLAHNTMSNSPNGNINN